MNTINSKLAGTISNEKKYKNFFASPMSEFFPEKVVTKSKKLCIFLSQKTNTVKFFEIFFCIHDEGKFPNLKQNGKFSANSIGFFGWSCWGRVPLFDSSPIRSLFSATETLSNSLKVGTEEECPYHLERLYPCSSQDKPNQTQSLLDQTIVAAGADQTGRGGGVGGPSMY